MWVLKHHSCRLFSKTLLTHQIKAKMVPSRCAQDIIKQRRCSLNFNVLGARDGEGDASNKARSTE